MPSTRSAAWRRLLLRPRTTLFTLLLLAVGVGLPTALFSLLDGVLLRGLPFPEGDRVVRVATRETLDRPVPGGDFDALCRAGASMGETDHPALDAVAGGLSVNTVVTRPGVGSKGMTGTYVTVDLFHLLGVRPVLGRDFTPADARAGAPGVVIVSDRLWRRWFGGDPDALGRTVIVNREPMTVVGVMPPGFQFPVRQEVWMPRRDEGWLTRAGVFAVGRLAPGVTAEEAAEALAPLAGRLDEEEPLPEGPDATRRITVEPYVESLVPPEVERSLRLMLWAVLGVLLIACGNIAGLRLGDALTRQRELAVRRALGARATQLLRPLLGEALVLTVVGAAAGLGLAWVLVHGAAQTILRGSMMQRLFWVDVRLDGRACAFAVAAAAVATLLGTLPPALWSIARHDLQDGLALGSGRVAGGRRGIRLAGSLVVAQVALCFVLVSSSALLVESGGALLSRAPGFAPDGLARVLVNPFQAAWKGPDAPRAFWNRLLPRLEEDPAIVGVTLASGVPWGTGEGESSVGVRTGAETADRAGLPQAGLLRVRPGFFETLGLPVVAGRALEPQDAEVAEVAAGDSRPAGTAAAGAMSEDGQTAPPPELPAVVSATFARHHFGRHPLDRSVELVDDRSGPPTRARVVGVVADRTVPEDTIYLPLSPATHVSTFLIARGRSGAAPDAQDLFRRIDRAVAGTDPLVATLDPATYLDDRAETVWVERRLAELFSLFAVTSLVLSALGLFGVALLSLHRRVRELAVRSALGAQPADLRGLLIRQGLTWIGCGLAGGAGLAWFSHRLLRAFLHGVAPWDPTLLAVSAALVTLSLLAAVAGPAGRAARTDPATALVAD